MINAKKLRNEFVPEPEHELLHILDNKIAACEEVDKARNET